MALSMKPKVILPIIAGGVATVAIILALTLSGGKKNDDFPIVTPTSTPIEATATPTPPYQASTPTATTTSATATPTQTLDDVVGTAEISKTSPDTVVFKDQYGNVKWENSVADDIGDFISAFTYGETTLTKDKFALEKIIIDEKYGQIIVVGNYDGSVMSQFAGRELSPSKMSSIDVKTGEEIEKDSSWISDKRLSVELAYDVPVIGAQHLAITDGLKDFIISTISSNQKRFVSYVQGIQGNNTPVEYVPILSILERTPEGLEARHQLIIKAVSGDAYITNVNGDVLTFRVDTLSGSDEFKASLADILRMPLGDSCNGCNPIYESLIAPQQ